MVLDEQLDNQLPIGYSIQTPGCDKDKMAQSKLGTQGHSSGQKSSSVSVILPIYHPICHSRQMVHRNE